MERGELIYLDNAATSYPKPPSVINQMRRFMLFCGGNPGRGAHMRSMEAAERVYECRVRLAELFEADSAEQIIFTMNTTQALNMAIKGLSKEGDHLLLSDLEHNAVYRPVYNLAKEGRVTFDVFPSMVLKEEPEAWRICAAIARRLRKNTRMVICTAGCNICSAHMPLAEIGSFCRRHGLLFVVDGAQCGGHRRISMRDMNIDALALPAHKGLLGPQGCGVLILREGLTASTLFEGGNGVASLEGDMPDYSPERYESGTLPVPAIVGLSEGVRTLSRLGIDAVEEHEKKLFRLCRQRLSELPDVKLYCPHREGGVLLFNVGEKSSEETAAFLSSKGICTRGGLHCNPLAHKALDTPSHGAVRVSFGVFNSDRDIDALCRALQELART